MALYIVFPVMVLLILRKMRGRVIQFVVTQNEHIVQATKWSGAFIFMCGIGHLLEGVLSFSWPNYFVFGTWHWATAIVSSKAFVHLIHVHESASF